MKQLIFSPQGVIEAYCMGVFPMGSERGDIRWYSPDPRCIIDMENFHASTRLLRKIRQGVFEMKVNHNWDLVIRKCAARKDVWISKEIIDMYTRLHHLGFAHSVEAYFDGELAGGLYGLALGGAFMGESMFHEVTDASKVSLVYLVDRLVERGFTLLDTQYRTEHLSKFSAVEIPRDEYLRRLAYALRQECSFV
ncbi:MAG TPA: leucyl/phenylalanyl-tRNA--protein transferase [Oculatellaceae cyanobacterium]